MFMAAHCFGFLSDEDNETLTEAARVYALLTMYRRGVVEAVLGSPKASNGIVGKRIPSLPGAHGGTEEDDKGADFYRDGVCELVPAGASVMGRYEAYLASLETAPAQQAHQQPQLLGGVADDGGESARVKGFINWISCNQARCLRRLAPIDQHLQTLMPSPADVADILRQLQTTRSSLPEALSEDRLRVVSLMQRAEDGLAQSDQTIADVQAWNCRGFSSFAHGAQAWRAIWGSLQAGVVWGYSAVPPGPGGASSVAGKSASTSSTAAPGGGEVPKAWRLDPAEGPERTRRRLEQCFGGSISDYMRPARVKGRDVVSGGAQQQQQEQQEEAAPATSFSPVSSASPKDAAPSAAPTPTGTPNSSDAATPLRGAALGPPDAVRVRLGLVTAALGPPDAAPASDLRSVTLTAAPPLEAHVGAKLSSTSEDMEEFLRQVRRAARPKTTRTLTL